MNSRNLIAALEAAGWVLRSTKGSHHVFRHPERAGILVVPHPRKDLGKGLVYRILKDAGIRSH
jgi:predicted RNA binding protein YcfA (HicA-like mRNA interferase family)